MNSFDLVFCHMLTHKQAAHRSLLTHTEWSITLSAAPSVSQSIGPIWSRQASAVVNNLMEVTVKVMSMERGSIPWAAEGMGGCASGCVGVLNVHVLQNKMSVLYFIYNRLFVLLSTLDFDRARHLRQGDQLWLSRPSWEAQHNSGPQRHTRYSRPPPARLPDTFPPPSPTPTCHVHSSLTTSNIGYIPWYFVFYITVNVRAGSQNQPSRYFWSSRPCFDIDVATVL